MCLATLLCCAKNLPGSIATTHTRKTVPVSWLMLMLLLLLRRVGTARQSIPQMWQGKGLVLLCCLSWRVLAPLSAKAWSGWGELGAMCEHKSRSVLGNGGGAGAVLQMEQA